MHQVSLARSHFCLAARVTHQVPFARNYFCLAFWGLHINSGTTIFYFTFTFTFRGNCLIQLTSYARKRYILPLMDTRRHIEAELRELAARSLPVPTEAEQLAQREGRGGLSKLTVEVTSVLIKHLKDGVHPETACRLAGITDRTLHNWVDRGMKDLEAQEPTEYVTFLLLLWEAEATSEADMVKKWKKHFAKDWRAVATFLERRYPERWAKRNELKVSGQVTHGVVMLPPLEDQTDFIEGEVLEDEDATVT